MTLPPAIRPWASVLAPVALVMTVGCGGAGDSNGDWYPEATAELGLQAEHHAGASGSFWLPEIMGPGLALFDADQDGDLDLYLPNGNDGLPDAARSGQKTNLFWVQENGRFADQSQASGLADPGYGMGACVGDWNNDGQVDLYLANYGPDRIYANLGAVRFEDRTDAARIAVPGWSCSAGFFDADRDGDLDLFVSQYVLFDGTKECFDAAGRRDYCGPKSFLPVPDVFLVNDGQGGFDDRSEASGIAAQSAAGLGVVFDDFDDDGWLDVYVANDAYANHLWRNRSDGSFQDEALTYGAAYNLHGQAEAGMGVIAADLDGDLLAELFVTHLNQESNTLYKPSAPRAFVDETGARGLALSSMRYTGFGVVAFDAELDGDLDLLVANGRVVRATPLPGALPEAPWDLFAEPNLFYKNGGQGRFEPFGSSGASLTEPIEVSRGIAAGDLDGDGDLDLVLSNTNGPLRAYRNEVPRQGSWLVVRAYDETLQRDMIGAAIDVHYAGRTLRRRVQSSSGYLTGGPLRCHFGLGANDSYDHIEVRWPDGVRERFPGGPADRLVHLVRGQGQEQG